MGREEVQGRQRGGGDPRPGGLPGLQLVTPQLRHQRPKHAVEVRGGGAGAGRARGVGRARRPYLAGDFVGVPKGEGVSGATSPTSRVSDRSMPSSSSLETAVGPAPRAGA
eukprot:TRINITY_DN7940_c0_g1_i1.p1 TRINITY_DN7940_c0_g1~~TRINITY_DN7940_c0_g1_i1.p1  ORF type:complete len:110 (-),score=2.30 TRINITY_DN7940_c0_g1_i1:61-390(-)